VSLREREYKARLEAKRRQGVLTDSLKEKLRMDILLLLDGKKRPKTPDLIQEQLVESLGWREDQIYGPKNWTWIVLNELVYEDLVQSRGVRTESYRIEFWK